MEVTEVTTGSQDDIIGTDVSDDRKLQAARQTIVDSLISAFGSVQPGKYNMNNGGAVALADRLRDPIQRAGVAMSEPQLQDLATNVTKFRDTPPRSGLIRKLDDLTQVPGVTPPS